MTTVIHHSADYDGIFCREIARKFLPGARLIGWDFGCPTPDLAGTGQIYILDLPLDCVGGWSEVSRLLPRLVWIDHHKSSLERAAAMDCDPAGYRIDGVAACRLAWQYFNNPHTDKQQYHFLDWPMPKVEDFVSRRVREPLAVRLAGEYEVWDHRGDGDVEFQFGLDSEEGLRWDWLLTEQPQYAQQIVAQGKWAMACYQKRDADVMRERSFRLEWEGLKFLALTSPRCNSNTFAALDLPETGHDALLAFFYDGSAWRVSLYHAAHRKDLDLSRIAIKYGGGGHRGACGFTVKSLPFIL